jgi:hypothetical protein
MARGGARPGAGRPARKSANTSPPSTRARARARVGSENQRPWPADKVERWQIDRLIPYAKNARTHTDAQVAAITASIKEWGWTSPALVGEDGGLIAGHARILATRQLGIVEIPVMVAAGWSEAQKRAYVLADNQLAITGSGWDPELLRLELGELKLGGFDLSLTGFGDLEEGSAGRADRGADRSRRRAGAARASGVGIGRSVDHGAASSPLRHAAGEGDARAGRNAQLGLGPAAGGEVVAAVDHSGGEGAVLEDGTHARAPGAEPESPAPLAAS